jgi:regulator of nucleoside diphosphate kinase
MKKLPIIISAADHEALSCAITAAGKLSERGRAELSSLAGELNRAKIVAPREIPPDVITMNSRAELEDLDTEERMEFTLVFPSDANIEEGRISILAPLGTAMLGYRVGDEFEWVVPYGQRRLRVTAVQFQPEAARAALAPTEKKARGDEHRPAIDRHLIPAVAQGQKHARADFVAESSRRTIASNELRAVST